MVDGGIFARNVYLAFHPMADKFWFRVLKQPLNYSGEILGDRKSRDADLNSSSLLRKDS